MGLVGLLCRLLFCKLLLCFFEGLLFVSILHQGQARGADPTFALWLSILEAFIGLLKGLVGLLDLLKLLLLRLKLSLQLFGVSKLFATSRSEKAMRMSFAAFITRIGSRLGLFLAAVRDFDCMRLVAVIMATAIMHLDIQALVFIHMGFMLS